MGCKRIHNLQLDNYDNNFSVDWVPLEASEKDVDMMKNTFTT